MPFLKILRRPERDLDQLLPDDSLTEHSSRVVACLFDGDLSSILEAIEDRRTCFIVRSFLFDALVLLAENRPDRRPAIEAFVRGFIAGSHAAPHDPVVGWLEAVVALGLVDMSETLRCLFDTGMIPEECCTFSEFQDALRETAATGSAPAWWVRREGLVEDAIEELSSWHCISDEHFARQGRNKAGSVLQMAPSTVQGEHRTSKTGRNAPCTCGSGKKCKKCCLSQRCRNCGSAG